MVREALSKVEYRCAFVYNIVSQHDGLYATEIAEKVKDILSEDDAINTVWRLANMEWIRQDESGRWFAVLV